MSISHGVCVTLKKTIPIGQCNLHVSVEFAIHVGSGGVEIGAYCHVIIVSIIAAHYFIIIRGIDGCQVGRHCLCFVDLKLKAFVGWMIVAMMVVRRRKECQRLWWENQILENEN